MPKMINIVGQQAGVMDLVLEARAAIKRQQRLAASIDALRVKMQQRAEAAKLLRQQEYGERVRRRRAA